MAKKAQDASEMGEVLRYVGVVDGSTGKCRVELRNYLRSHPFAQLQVASSAHLSAYLST